MQCCRRCRWWASAPFAARLALFLLIKERTAHCLCVRTKFFNVYNRNHYSSPLKTSTEGCEDMYLINVKVNRWHHWIEWILYILCIEGLSWFLTGVAVDSRNNGRNEKDDPHRSSWSGIDWKKAISCVSSENRPMCLIGYSWFLTRDYTTLGVRRNLHKYKRRSVRNSTFELAN